MGNPKKIKYWKLPWQQKVDGKPENFTYRVNFFVYYKNVTKPPLIFESVPIQLGMQLSSGILTILPR